MVDNLGHALRSLREAADLSLAALAARTNYSRAFICNIENGRRRATADYAAACDQAFNTAPLLSMLWEIDHGGDDVKRRAFLTSVGAASALGLASAAALGEVIRSGLLDSTGDSEDWDAVVADYDRRLVIDPSQDYGRSLLSQLVVARQLLADRGKTPERLRAIAHLGQLYGLWLGNQGQVPAARGWYRTAMTIADQSGDSSTRVYVRGRALSRGIYEGYTATETVNGVHEALSLSPVPTLGALESYSALVHVHALTGNLPDGRRAVEGMRRVVDGLPDNETSKVAGPVQRTAHFNSYLECRLGTPNDAETAFHEAEPILRPIPVWHADSRIYYGRAQVAAGDVSGGISYALDAVKNLQADVRVLKVGVQDLVTIVPPRYHSDDLDELKTYAAVGNAPWKTVGHE